MADGYRKEMESDSGAIKRWEVRWLTFNTGADSDLVNAELARVAAGWEPFATLPFPGGFALLVKRHADTA